MRLLFPGVFCRAVRDPIVLTAWLGELPSAAITSCGPDPTPRPRGHFQGRDQDKVTVNTSPFLRALTVTYDTGHFLSQLGEGAGAAVTPI